MLYVVTFVERQALRLQRFVPERVYDWVYEYEDRLFMRVDYSKRQRVFGLSTNIRWRISQLLNKRPDTCWSSLADYALGHKVFPRYGSVEYCQNSARSPELGACYCGKFISAEAAKIVDNPDERFVVT